MNRYSALAVAKFILSRRPMTNLRLQKTLYFIQAAFLLTRERGIFDDEIVNRKTACAKFSIEEWLRIRILRP